MILSVSRRTDIPAFYADWFLNRLDAGFVLVPNPMNPRQVSRVSLDPRLIDCIVFWTKNPAPLIEKLDRIGRIPFYFLFTVTPYGPDLEKHLPPKPEILETFARLSRLIGPERVVWRYDPVIFTPTMDETFHVRRFQDFARFLAPYTRRCIFSFLDMYKKCERNLQHIPVQLPGPEAMARFTSHIIQIAGEYRIQLFTCAENADYSSLGVEPGRCIDDRLIAGICGYPLDVGKDKNQRDACRCVESVDIGAYHTCPHICLYCYANSDPGTVAKNAAQHDPEAPVLYGAVPLDVQIKDRRISSFKRNQNKLF